MELDNKFVLKSAKAKSESDYTTHKYLPLITQSNYENVY